MDQKGKIVLLEHFYNLTLKNKLLITYLTLTILAVGLLGISSYWIFSAAMTRQVKDYTSLVARQINKDMDAYIERLERVTYSAYLNIDLERILENNHRDIFKHRLENRDRVNQFISRMFIIDSNVDGTYIYSRHGDFFYDNTQGVIRNDYRVETKTWYSKITTDNKIVLLPPHREEKYFNPMNIFNLSVIRPLNNVYNGRFIGFIMMDMNAKAIDQIVGDTVSANKSRLLIFDEKNVLFYDSALSGIIKKEAGRPGTQPTMKSLKKDYLIIGNTSAKTGWKVVFATPYAVIMAKANQTRNITIMIALCCILVFSMVSVWIAGGISKPLNKLKQTIALVENGDLNASMETKYRDEIGELGRSFNKMVQNIKRLVKEVYEARLKTKEAEFNALESQINPHFMYNTLESINMTAILKNDFEVSDGLTAFGNILRVNMDTKNSLVTVEQELQYVLDYLKIMKLRFGEKIAAQVEVDDALKSFMILKISIQPLVENAIIHGFSEKRGSGLIKITIRQQNDLLIIAVSDNGLGMTGQRMEDVRKSLDQEEVGAKKGSIGLKNVHDRIKLYFGSDYGLKIDSEFGKGTTVEMNLPVRVKENESGQRG